MKKLISVILAAVMCFSAFSVIAYAEQEEVTDPLTYTVDAGGYATLADCDEAYEGEIIVPAVVEIDGEIYPVKYIGKSAFEDCALITAVIISEGVEQIGDFAFYNCTALTDVYVPESLLVCMYTAFNGCNTVTVHCYSVNYQFFTVFGIINNLRIDIIDSTGDELDLGSGLGMGGISSVDMTNTILLLVKRIIQVLVYFFINRGTDNTPEEDVEIGEEDEYVSDYYADESYLLLN